MLVASVGVNRVYQLCKMLTSARRPDEREKEIYHSVLVTRIAHYSHQQARHFEVLSRCRVSTTIAYMVHSNSS